MIILLRVTLYIPLTQPLLQLAALAGRPADIFVSMWAGGREAALDVVHICTISLCSLDFGNIDDHYRGPRIKEKVWLSPAAAEWQVCPSPQAPPSLTVLP